MRRYIARRVIVTVPMVLLVTVVGFLMLEIMPGDPLAMYLQNPYMTTEDMQRLTRLLGLDEPLPIRYAKWLGRFVRGDWGRSFVTWQPVLKLVNQRLPNTLLLMASAYTLTLFLAIPIGVMSAVRQYSSFDFGATATAFMCLSVPGFWLGLILILVFCVILGWLPAVGMATLGEGFDLGDRVRHMILPVTVLAMNGIGVYVRYVRASMLETLSQDFIRTARAKGLKERVVLYRHALSNALLPFITVAALQFRELVTGAVVVEMIFCWPGMGRLLWDAALWVDYPVIMGITTLSAVLVLLCSLAADILYALVDPRIRFD